LRSEAADAKVPRPRLRKSKKVLILEFNQATEKREEKKIAPRIEGVQAMEKRNPAQRSLGAAYVKSSSWQEDRNSFHSPERHAWVP